MNASPAVGALAGLSFAWELDQEHSNQGNSTDGQILPAKAAKSGESEPAKEVLQTHGVWLDVLVFEGMFWRVSLLF